MKDELYWSEILRDGGIVAGARVLERSFRKNPGWASSAMRAASLGLIMSSSEGRWEVMLPSTMASREVVVMMIGT